MISIEGKLFNFENNNTGIPDELSHRINNDWIFLVSTKYPENIQSILLEMNRILDLPQEYRKEALSKIIKQELK